ncbi:MAG: hypothetical protein NC828_04130 [Candidatus Omnitrophica bacterium]|nr:hypothetical protein [Candidatus Omnitrophota bacterium]
MEPIRKLLRELENEISSEKFIQLYERIREKYPPIKSYLTAWDLIERLHNQTNPDFKLNDEILSSLILEYQSQQESASVGSYLLILFKPGLLKIFSHFKSRAKQLASLGELDLWCQIVAFFFEELSQLDLNKDKTKITSKVLGRLRNRLRDYFTVLFKELGSEQELAIHPESIPSLPAQINTQETIPLLENLVKLGVISKIDKYILLATKVYGRSMKDISQELKGLSYAAIRQRKTRAQKAIRTYLGKKKI